VTIRGIKATWRCKVCLTEVVIESNLKTTQGILELLRGHENTCTDGLPPRPPTHIEGVPDELAPYVDEHMFKDV
jgi:hypothetical protein